MISIICAMHEERDAILSLLKNVKKVKYKKLKYHGKELDTTYYFGKINGKDVCVAHCGVGKVYAAIITSEVIFRFKPSLIINLGCAGSLSKNVNVGDTVIATRIADWDVDVPGWKRSIFSNKMSFSLDKRFIECAKKIKDKTIKFGHIVSGDEFISKDSQLKEIKKYFPTALCGEMEGCSIANTCYAYGVKSAVIRSISDITYKKNNYKSFNFNLKLACEAAAKLCIDIISIY